MICLLLNCYNSLPLASSTKDISSLNDHSVQLERRGIKETEYAMRNLFKKPRPLPSSLPNVPSAVPTSKDDNVEKASINELLPLKAEILQNERNEFALNAESDYKMGLTSLANHFDLTLLNLRRLESSMEEYSNKLGKLKMESMRLDPSIAPVFIHRLEQYTKITPPLDSLWIRPLIKSSKDVVKDLDLVKKVADHVLIVVFGKGPVMKYKHYLNELLDYIHIKENMFAKTVWNLEEQFDVCTHYLNHQGVSPWDQSVLDSLITVKSKEKKDSPKTVEEEPFEHSFDKPRVFRIVSDHNPEVHFYPVFLTNNVWENLVNPSFFEHPVNQWIGNVNEFYKMETTRVMSQFRIYIVHLHDSEIFNKINTMPLDRTPIHEIVKKRLQEYDLYFIFIILLE